MIQAFTAGSSYQTQQQAITNRNFSIKNSALVHIEGLSHYFCNLK